MKSRNFADSLRNAWRGIRHAIIHERNFRIHIFFALAAVVFCIWFDVGGIYSFMVLYAIFSVLCMELINTAVEAIVDMFCGQKPNQFAKIAKDCCAGAVLLAAIQAVLVAVIVGQYLLTR